MYLESHLHGIMQISMCEPSLQIFNKHQMHQRGLEEGVKVF